MERVEADVDKGLVSREKAESDYGVLVDDATGTEKLREAMRAKRGEVKDFDLGPPLEEILANCEAETSLQPPVAPEPLSWAPMETGEQALRRVREQDQREASEPA